MFPATGTEVGGLCGDGLDNDCDGLTDGGDGDCGSEDCANGVDDNNDGAVDCLDQGCAADPACAGEPGVCDVRELPALAHWGCGDVQAVCNRAIMCVQ